MYKKIRIANSALEVWGMMTNTEGGVGAWLGVKSDDGEKRGESEKP